MGRPGSFPIRRRSCAPSGTSRSRTPDRRPGPSLALAAGASALYVALMPAIAGAHERFVKHSLKQHLKYAFFMQQAGAPFGMDPNMIQIGLLVTLVLAAFFVFFFLREGLDEIIRYK